MTLPLESALESSASKAGELEPEEAVLREWPQPKMTSDGSGQTTG